MCSVLEVCVDSTASALAAKRGGNPQAWKKYIQLM